MALAGRIVSPRVTVSGPTGGSLVLAGAAGELDQVLVEFEPDAVVAVHAG